MLLLKTMKRKITPHKGGRTARLNIRLPEEIKELAFEKAEKYTDGNVSDLVIAAISTYKGGGKPPVLKTEAGK